MYGGQSTAEKAILNAQVASNLVKEKQKTLNNAKAAKLQANANYNSALKEQQNIKAKANAAKKALQNAAAAEQTAKAQANAAQTEVAKLKTNINSLQSDTQDTTASTVAEPNMSVNTFGGSYKKRRVRKLKRKTKKARKGKGRYTHRK